MIIHKSPGGNPGILEDFDDTSLHYQIYLIRMTSVFVI